MGNGGSIFLREMYVKIAGTGPARISPERDAPFREMNSVTILQASSGGENWQSETHLDNNRQVPMPFRGYRLDEEEALRATPILMQGSIGLTMHRFWENFPKSVGAYSTGLSLGLFPALDELTLALTFGQFPNPTSGLHELQGGEQKTHTFTVAFGESGITDEPLVWARSPLQVSCSSEWYARCEALPHLTPKSTDPHALYLKTGRSSHRRARHLPA